MAAELAEKHYWDLAGWLNLLAKDFLNGTEDTTCLEMAAKWSARAIELQPAYPYLHTYGMIQKKLGHTQAALEYLAKAIEAAKESGNTFAETQAAWEELQEKQGTGKH
jgi:tetratricopeptide (TPR) repeat protein